MPDVNDLFYGAGRIFIAPFDTDAPATLPLKSVPLDGAWASPWAEVGYTTEGATLNIEREYIEHEVAELKYTADVEAGKSSTKISFESVADTLESMKLALGGTISTTAPTTTLPGFKTLQLANDVEYLTLGFEAPQRDGKWRRILVPKVVNMASLEVKFNKGQMRGYNFEFTMLGDIADLVIETETLEATG